MSAPTSTRETTTGRSQSATARPAAVQLEGVTKTFGKIVAVDEVGLEIGEGEFFSLLGPSGSGKTTCLRMIAGFEHPTAGRVLLGGQDVTRVAPYERDVNTVFQDYALFPHMTVSQNVAYGLMVKKVPKDERNDRVRDALAMVHLDAFADRKPAQLSGGQRQRVALARALVNRPSVLLLDEPLGALDLKLRQAMQIELKSIQREVGITFIYVTHDQEEALTMSDRLAVFNEGRIAQIGTPAEVYENPTTAFVAGFVGVSNVLRGELAGLVGTSTHDVFTLRPEKIRLVDTSYEAASDEIVIDGAVRDVVYLGVHTRYLVEVSTGDDVIVVEQNLDTSSSEAHAVRGRAVRLAWKRASTRPLAGGADETRAEERDVDNTSKGDTE